MKKIKIFCKTHMLFTIFSILYFLLAFTTYKDYGITLDEKVEYDAGTYLLEYFKTKITPDNVLHMLEKKPLSLEYRHTPLFSVYSRVYPMALSIFNPNQYFEWYHLMNLIAGYGIFLSAYILLFTTYNRGLKAITGPILLLLHPYIFGHIPANPKDIPFATIYLLSITAISLLTKEKINPRMRVIVLGVLFGLTISLRVVGVTLFIILILYTILTTNYKIKDICIESIIITFFAIFIWAITMPFLGVNIIKNMITLIVNASFYSAWKGTIFYLGQYLTREQRPWHYLFIIYAVKTPLATVLLFVAGLIIYINGLIKKHSLPKVETLLLITISVNVILYLITNPVVYNGIRHFLFLVVITVILAGVTLSKIVTFTTKANATSPKRSLLLLKSIIIVVLSLYFIITIYKIVQLHPFEYIYFNELTNGLKGADKLFQTDYWGASYIEAADYLKTLKQTDYNGKDLNVFACDNRFAMMYYSEFKFKLASNPKESNIIVCDAFRDRLRNLSRNYPQIDAIKREGVDLILIRKNPKPNLST